MASTTDLSVFAAALIAGATGTYAWRHRDQLGAFIEIARTPPPADDDRHTPTDTVRYLRTHQKTGAPQ